jgi:3-oxoadipate enol-lactonase
MFCSTSDQKKIYYELAGNAQAEKTIVFLNGLSQSTQAWALLTPYFKSQYKILLLDFIFQGNSDKDSPVRDFDQHARDVVDVLKHLKIEKVILVGLSYGSLVSQHLAVNYPAVIDKLILLSTFAQKTPYYKAIELSWQRALDSGGYELLLDVMLPFVLSENYFKNPLIPIDLLKAARKEMVDYQALKKLMQATGERPDYLNQLQKIDCPTLILHGRYDALFNIDMGKAVSDHIKDSKFFIVEKAGHTLNLEEVPQVAQQILSFI